MRTAPPPSSSPPAARRRRKWRKALGLLVRGYSVAVSARRVGWTPRRLQQLLAAARARRTCVLLVLLLLPAPAPAQVPPPIARPRDLPPPLTLAQWAAAKALREDYTVTSDEFAFGPAAADARWNTARRRDVYDAMIVARRARQHTARWLTLRFPDRTTYFDRPFLPGDPTIRLLGDGANAAWKMAANRDDGLLVLGVPTHFMAGGVRVPLSADHWFPAAGKYDASVTTPKWGLRTKGSDGHAHVASMAGYWSYPAGYWADSPGVCLQVALDSTDAPVPTNVPIGGLSEFGVPSPWLCWTQADRVLFYLATVRPDGTTQTRAAAVPMPTARGVHRYTLQHDLASGVFTAIVDGVVSHPAMTSSAHGPIAPGARFAANDMTPCLVGAFGSNSNSSAADISTVTGRDVAILGFKVSDRPEYREDGARLDGQADTDQRRYFTQTPGTLGYLTLADDPEVAAADRLVTIAGGGRQLTAYFLGDAHGNPYAAVANTEIRDLTFAGSYGSSWGQCVALGYALYVDAQRCKFLGHAHGFASARFGANYVITLRDCEAAGSDAALYNDYGIWRARGIHVNRHGRATIRSTGLLEGSDWFLSYEGQPEWIYRGTRGATLILRDAHVDIESGPYPTRGYFYAEGGGQNPGGVGGQLKLTDVTLGLAQPRTNLVTLRNGPGSGTCRVDVENLSWVGGADRTRLFDLEGADRWRGAIRVNQLVPVQDAPGTAGVIVTQP